MTELKPGMKILLPNGQLIKVKRIYECKICLKPIVVVGDEGWATFDNPECREHDKLLEKIEEKLREIGAQFEINKE